MTEPNEIATLPPLEKLQPGVTRSPRTGEPRRPAALGVAAVVLYLAAVGVAAAYGLHWWEAAHPETYPASARLVDWVDPDPGKWLSLTLEGILAAAAVIAAGVPAVAGFQSWNGRRWGRWAGLLAVALTGGFAALTHDWGFVAVGLAVVGSALLWLPPVSRYLADWDRVRAERPVPYRRPESIFYGRLPRFR